MVTLADSLVSSASRPLSLRVRPDLSARKHQYHGRAYWIVKEPVALNYYRFHEEEYAILRMLDGQSSMQDIKDRFEREFTPQKITFQDLQQFIGMLHRSGLVTSSAPGQGRQLKRRRDEKKRKELLGKLANVFALRWRGIDPERLLNRIYPYTGWFFSRQMVCFCLLFALCALSLLTVQFDIFRSRLPAFHQFFGVANWPYLAVTMAVAKVLHEFGHGLSCKRFKGECHEMGFMLLVFTPALYCNVSDSWMLPNKWHRAAIGAAGMYVELTLASIATFLWWFSEPGMLNHLCLSLMFVCSVSTLMFNGNPLLRFDGYYILMDIVEIPNLRQKSTEILKRFLVWLCLGIEQPENPFLPQKRRFLFGLYTIAAVIYRWFVVFSILIFLNKVLEPYGLKIIGRLIGAIGFFGLVVQPLWQLGKFFYTPGRMHKVKQERVLATVGVIGAVTAAVIYLPLPFHVDCTFEVRPQNAASVYTVFPCRLEQVLIKPGDHVEQGQEIVHIDNIDLRLALLQTEGQRLEAEHRRDNLQQQRYKDPSASAELEQINKLIDTIDQQLEQRRHELGISHSTELPKIVAPVSGIVISPRARPASAYREGTLPAWTGTPLENRNKGAHLAAGDEICQIVQDTSKLEAVLVIDQADVGLVREAQQVSMRLDAYPNNTFDSEIQDVGLLDMKTSPIALSTQAGGDLDTVMDSSGAPKPLSTSYPARAPLDDPHGMMQVGLRGRAKIYTGWQPLGRRIYRFVARTFHFEL